MLTAPAINEHVAVEVSTDNSQSSHAFYMSQNYVRNEVFMLVKWNYGTVAQKSVANDARV
jgi:hypothetical protein